MLTVMCPNCRHRFPAPGCCEPTSPTAPTTTTGTTITGRDHGLGCYYGGLLVPRNATAGCFINAPTIVNGPTIIQTGGGPQQQQQQHILGDQYRHVTTTCDLTGGSVTITTPGIQSGGCLIQSIDSGFLVQPHIEVRPKLSGGGGVLVQKRFSTDEEEEEVELEEEEEEDEVVGVESEEMLSTTSPINGSFPCCEDHRCQPNVVPSGCQELPGIRRSAMPKFREDGRDQQQQHFDACRLNRASRCDGLPTFPGMMGGHARLHQQSASTRQQVVAGGQCNCCREQVAKSCCCCCSNAGQNLRKTSVGGGGVGGVVSDGGGNFLGEHENAFGKFAKDCLGKIGKDAFADVREKSANEQQSNGLQIQVNATVQLPASLGQCTLSITATTTTTPCSPAPGSQRSRNNFNGGGLVQADATPISSSNNNNNNNNASSVVINPGNVNSNERRDGAPSTPVSWLMPCPWGFDTYLADRDDTRLQEVRRLLQTSGWYHDGLSWQQSESLLKNAPIGRWLMRDSSDSRYTFAVSVQTTRGPTSVRVHYFLGRFRLDAEPRLALAMPVFDCPIKMLEYYVNYSKRIDEREQVWVDYSGQVYSQIYLTKPLVKEVRSLSHLARLAVNRNKLPTEQLPPLIRNYLAEYPYTL